jgi:hypothetical protein
MALISQPAGCGQMVYDAVHKKIGPHRCKNDYRVVGHGVELQFELNQRL